MKFHTIIPLILTLSLLGCQPSPPLPTGVPFGDDKGLGVGETSTATTTPAPTTTPTFSPTPTEVPLESLLVEEIVQKYLAGEIDDVSGLNFEQQKTFSIALNEKKNEQRGSNPIIYTDKDGAKFYIDPITGKFLPVDNGTTAKEQTIEMYLPRVVDGEGYTHIFHEGEWVKIAGSQNIQFDDFDNFPWPKTEMTTVLNEKTNLPMTMPEWLSKNGSKKIMLPIIVLSKEIGEFNIVDWGDTGTITVYIPHENDPYSVRRSKMIGNITLYADSVTAGSPGEIRELSWFWRELEENTVYYMIVSIDQKSYIAESLPDTKGQEITTTYKGIAPTDLTTNIITGKTTSNDITLIKTQAIVKKLGD